jgi:hypothetical protein
MRQIKHHSLWKQDSRLKLLLHPFHKHFGVSEMLVVSESRQYFRGGQVVKPEGLVS